jgi:hypothetical protein
MSLTKYHFDFNLENCVLWFDLLERIVILLFIINLIFNSFFTFQEIKEYMLFLIVSTLVSRNLNFLFFIL